MPLHDDTIQLLERLRSGDGEDPPVLADTLTLLLSAAVRAVPSCFGLALTLDRNGCPFTISASLDQDPPLDPSDSAGGTLLIHLPRRTPTGAAQAGPRLVFYASTPGAFARFRVDVLALLDLDPTRATEDRPLTKSELGLPSRSVNDSARQLDDISVVDQALGVLLDRGYLTDDGRKELERQAVLTGQTVPDVARALLDSIVTGDGRAPPPVSC